METKLKIVADSNIPFLQGVFEPYAEVVYKEGTLIGREDVLDADALLTRTRTKCNEALLSGSRISMIATATIGQDHIDLDYCSRAGIEVHNSQGCNAGGVMQYVFSALYGTASRKSIKIDRPVMGIIGVGHVGKRVEEMARYLGFQVLRCDPPRAEAEGPDGFCSLDYLLRSSNIVTIHTPLDETTKNMADEKFFEAMRPGAFFINAARGEIVDEAALMEAIPKLGPVIIDTWCHEPEINTALMEKTDIATPHIAGYSFQGKLNGTASAVQAVARHFRIEALYDFFPEYDEKEHAPVRLNLKGKTQGEIASVFQYNYPIFTDDFMFRVAPENFEKMRTHYQYRREICID